MTQRECCILNALKNQILDCQEELALRPPVPEIPVLLAVTKINAVAGTNPIVTPAIDTTGAGFIVINAANFTLAPGSPSDSYGNAWTLAKSQIFNGFFDDIYICYNPNVGPGHTFSATWQNGGASLEVAAFSWAGVLQGSIGSGIVAGVLAINPGSLTATSQRTLFITGLAHLWNDVTGLNDGFKMIADSSKNPSPFTAGGGLAYKIVEGPVVANPTWQGTSGTPEGAASALIMLDAITPVTTTPFEPAAWEHWRFDQLTEGNITAPIVGAKGNAATPIAHVIANGKTIKLPGNLPGFLNGLLTTFTERPDFTFCTVIRRPLSVVAPNFNMFFQSAAFGALNGVGLWVDGATSHVITVGGMGISAQYGVWADLNILPGEWCFAVMRLRTSLAGTKLNNGPIGEMVAASVMAARPIGIGHAYGASAVQALEAEFAEVIIFDAALTDAQLNEVYQRSKLRMAEIGISITGGLPNAVSSLLIASTSKGLAAGGGFTDPIDTTGASLIVLNLGYYNGGTVTGVHDSQGNTYLPLAPHTDVGTGAVQQLYYCENPNTGVAHQFQINGASFFPSVQAAVFGAGISINPLDQEAGGSGSGLSLSIGPVSQTTASSLVIAGVAFADAMPSAPDAPGYTIIGAEPYIFGQHMGSAMSFKESDSMIVHNINWDFAVFQSGIAAGIATFKRD